MRSGTAVAVVLALAAVADAATVVEEKWTARAATARTKTAMLDQGTRGGEPRSPSSARDTACAKTIEAAYASFSATDPKRHQVDKIGENETFHLLLPAGGADTFDVAYVYSLQGASALYAARVDHLPAGWQLLFRLPGASTAAIMRVVAPGEERCAFQINLADPLAAKAEH